MARKFTTGRFPSAKSTAEMDAALNTLIALHPSTPVSILLRDAVIEKAKRDQKAFRNAQNRGDSNG